MAKKEMKEWGHGWKAMFLGAALMLSGFVWKYYGPEMALASFGAVLFIKGFMYSYMK